MCYPWLYSFEIIVCGYVDGLACSVTVSGITYLQHFPPHLHVLQSTAEYRVQSAECRAQLLHCLSASSEQLPRALLVFSGRDRVLARVPILLEQTCGGGDPPCPRHRRKILLGSCILRQVPFCRPPLSGLYPAMSPWGAKLLSRGRVISGDAPGSHLLVSVVIVKTSKTHRR